MTWSLKKPPPMKAASIALASIAILFLVGAMADPNAEAAEGVAKQHATTQGSTPSVEGAAGLDVPEDRRARRKGGSNEVHKSRRAIRLEEKKNKRAQKQAKKDARRAEASARRSKLAELTETLGPEAAKQALRSETNEARRAKKKERVDARNAEKQARKSRRKMIRDQTRPNRRASTGRTRSLGGGFAALHPDFVAKTLPGPVHKTAQCKGSTSGLYTESVAGNNTRYARCEKEYEDPYTGSWGVYSDSGPGGYGYYPGSDPLPWREECWKGIAREEPIPGNQVTVDMGDTEWIVYSPVDPNIAYFMTWYWNMEIKMIDFSTPDNMVTHIAGAETGIVPGDTRYPEYQGCYVDVFNVSEETNSTELLQWRYTYRSYSKTDNTSDSTLADGEVFVPDTDYHFFNATVSPQGCGTHGGDTHPEFRDQVEMLPAPAKDFSFGGADWYSVPAITSDGEIMYLMMTDDHESFMGILALNLTSGNMSEVVNFWGDENSDTPWYNDNGNEMYTGTMQLSHDDSTLYIMTDGDWASSRNYDTEVWSLNLVTGEFKMVFDVYASFGISFRDDADGAMVLAPDGKKMWFASDDDSEEALVGFMNMDDFSGAIVYDRYNEWPDNDDGGPSIYFDSYYYLSMTPDSKNLVIYNDDENTILIMPTTPPYNMHSIIGFQNYAMPGDGIFDSEWENGGEWTLACPDRTCDGPVGFANWDYNSLGAMSPDGSFILAVEDDSDQQKFRKIYIDNRCKVATCG